MRYYDILLGIAKHLCGSATDLTIQSLCEYNQTYGVVIATCWHHRCDLRTYVNLSFLDSLGFKSEEDKYYLFKLTSWDPSGVLKIEKEDSDISELSVFKVNAGVKTKRILELGRTKNLEEKLRLKLTFQQYWSKEESAENMLLIGVKD